MNNDSPARILKALLGTAAMLFVHTVAGLTVFVPLCKVVPVYEQSYDDFKQELPAVTVAMLDLSHFMASYWHLVAPVLLILDGAILLVLHLVPPGARWLATCWNTAVLLGVILFLGYAALALAAPLVRINQEIAAAPRGHASISAAAGHVAAGVDALDGRGPQAGSKSRCQRQVKVSGTVSPFRSTLCVCV